MMRGLGPIVGAFLLLLLASPAFSNAVNRHIVTGWEYLNSPELLRPSEKARDTTIGFDEYRSDQEFLESEESRIRYRNILACFTEYF